MNSSNSWRVSNMSSCPKLRIEGFTDAWEQRKVGELIKSHNAGIYISKDRYGEGTNIIGVSNIYDSDIFNGEIYRLGPVDDESFLLEEGDLVYGESSLVPEGIARTICVGKNGAGSAFAWHTRRIKLNQEIVNSHFATLELNYHPVVRKHLIRVATQTALTGMTTDGYFSAPLFMPSVKEQEKISNFFICLDNLITLHQRKSDALKNAKKYFLKNMFPSEGEKFPKLRLEGFTDAWEQRKVTELGEIYIGLVTTMTSHYTDHGTLLIRNSDIKDAKFEFGDNPIYLDDEFAKKNASRKHRVGDVITVHTGDIGTSAVITEKEAGSIGFATIVTRPNTSVVTSDFLCTYLNTDNHKNFAMNISTGDGRNNYNLKDYYECVVPVPPNINEQIKISSFIGRINNLITLHQRKYEKLKNIKQAMLEKMFI